MTTRIENKEKVIWITGASSGIGKATALAFAQKGYKMLLTALEADLLEEVQQVALQLGSPQVVCLPFDLSKLEELPMLADRAWEQFGRIDIFYNNAGISQRGTTVETDMQVIHKVMNVDYYAPVILTKSILPKMLQQGYGQLAVTTSIAGKFGFPLRSAYCSAKHALYGFYETIQAEYYSQNIRVTIVCPGRVQTNISINALEKNGQRHGVMDQGQANGITAEKAGRQICKAIESQKREVLIGSKELMMVYVKRFFPALAAKIARHISNM